LPYASHFMSDFQVIIMTTISCFRNYTFAVHGERVTLNSANGFQVKKIVPSGFELQNHITISVSPFTRDFLDSDFAKDIPKPLQREH
ncbi:hypothetical protein CU098_005986, partial [Rhizopus stolonifer]